MKDNYDLFNVVKGISRALRDTGHEALAEKIDEALSISTMPGEILGETLLQLRQLPKEAIRKAGKESQVKTALKYLDGIMS